MDGNITARFYDVLREEANLPSLKEVLEEIHRKGLEGSRATLDDDDFKVRLERLDSDGQDVVVGEFTREQTKNLPSEVHPDGVRPLSIQRPLGHGIAFRFNHRLAIIAVQFDVRILGPGKVLEFLTAHVPQSKFRLRPIMKKDMWERFESGPAKKIGITVASPTTIPELEDEAESVGSSIRTMGAAYEAPEITIELNVGRRQTRLSDKVRRVAEIFLERHAKGEIDLRKLQANVDQGEGFPTDEIDLLSEFLSAKDKLTLPDKDTKRNFEMRSMFLKTAMNQHV